ncbi:MAG: MATE family efflux transporter [Oscillospiraceae bacterium]|nr:MATE family efflux transporter [Oscillospiraceae bacterium]
MENIQKSELFERTSIPRAVLTLSIPTVLSSLVMVLYNLADTYFVGMLQDSIQNSAVTLAAPVLLAFNAVNNLFGVGSSSMMSRALGAKDYDTVRRSSAFGFYCALICGVLFSLFTTVFHAPLLVLLGADADTAAATAQYLLWTTTCGAAPAILNVVMAYLVRSEGATLHASIGTMSGCLLNIVLDPIFILPWGLNMGAAGAGLATFLSNCFACLYFFVLLFVRRGKTFVCIHPAMARPRREIVKGVFGVGIPASIQNLLNVTGMTVLNNFTAGFGPDAIAAMGISYKINMIPMYISQGMSQGLMPLVSYNYGSGNVPRLKKAVQFTQKVALTFMVTVSVCYFFASGTLISLFMKTDAVVAYGSRFLRCMCVAQPFLCMDFLAVNVFQACGLGQYSLLFAILRKIVLEIPALYILNYFFPLYGLACAQTVAEIVLAAAAVIILLRLFRRMSAEGTPLRSRGEKK